MKRIRAADITRYQHFTCLIYSEPGKGKTSMIKSLKGKSLVWSTDGMYSVLEGEDNVEIWEMEPEKPLAEMESFYKDLRSEHTKFDNIIIDNLSTFIKMWLNAKAKETKSGMPELKDYAIVDRVIFDFIASLKKFKKNLILFAHEEQVEIKKTNGGVYTQHRPMIRTIDAIMGIIPLVGRLVVIENSNTGEEERIIVMQPTQSTRAKDQLIGHLKTINQMELFPLLQKGE
ncbi:MULTISPECIES: AAA family ATPase [unclassified Facklamia]|uniref:AAA family ATPase n=1 Tax=Aerococcaceae TaxID=186827 RepID=UPI0013BDAA04|nr:MULTISPECIES: AAA family ATPase [unclassified Facklamia]MBS4462901.1 AAA family ATPase [Aerococcaceae bacterium zg-B36]NEW65299.1 AAA family ATPase [Facklamia sp. 252]NEW68801.1 AAA family ATPase [Facklamia sp. 253]QQD66112.1 AAA family ATPase [Aerococcaceae bacterium zg-252]